MPDDYSANAQTTGAVAVGGSATGTIETAYDQDWFAVELVAGRTYVIDLRGSPTDDGTLSDPYLRGIYDADGNRIANTTNDDGGRGYNSRLTFTATESGTHYIAAGAWSSRRGTYEVEVTDTSPPPAETAAAAAESETDQNQALLASVSEGATDLPDDASTPGRVAVGDTATGTIGTAREKDWFAVELVAGRTYVIDLRGSPTDDGTLSDPYLRGIYDADGNRIANTTNDDGGRGYNSRLTFTATESGTHYIAAGAWSSRRGTYEVEVTDTSPPETPQEQVQQQPPAFDRQAYLFELEENADGSTDRLSLGTVSAADPDGGSVSYGIEGGNESGRFEIDAASGELFYVGAGEDYETGSTRFELTVRASDGDQTTDATVTVDVTDAAEAPAFAQAGYAFALAENADGSVARLSLGTVSATDPDGGSVSYGIEGGNESGRFEIDAASGELFYVGGGEDYETGSTSFELTVRASDGDQTTDATVTVDVTDAAEAPAFAQAGYAFDLAEDTDGSANRISLGTVSATDPDGGSVSYGIEGGNESGRFEIDAASGELFYVGGGEDYETGSTSFELTVRASDGEQTTDTAVTVNVTDVDEPVAVDPPVAQEVQSVPQTVSEGATDLPNDNSTPGRVAVGGSATGTIGSAYDHDRFAVELEAGRTYQFDLEGSPGGGGTLPDTYFRAIRDSEGRYQSGTYNDNFEGSRDSRVTFTPEASGTYYAQVSGDRDETGTYTLTVTDMTAPETDGSTTNPVVPEPEEPTVEFVGPDQDAQQQPETSQVQTEPMSVSEGATDLPTNTSTTGRVVVGGSATGAVETAGDQDWFAVELEAGKIYRFDLEGKATGGGTLFNPYLRGIYDADGEWIANTKNNNGGTSWNSRVYFSPNEEATYYVATGAYGANWGTYTLSVTERPADDYAADPDPATTGTVEDGGSVEGNIDHFVDQDWFAVALEAGKTYRFDLKGSRTNDGTLADPYLRGIYDADGEWIANTKNNNGGTSWNSRVYFSPNEEATYYVAAGSNRNRVGTYTLSVTEFADDYAAEPDPDTTGTVAVEGSAMGNIDFPGDQDWFAVTLEAGATYRFDLKGIATGGGTLFDPYLRGIYDANGERIANTTDDNGGWLIDSRVYFTPNEEATYYVAAGADGDCVGTYTLSVTERPADDYAADPATTGTVAVGGSVEGNIEPPGDKDWFAVELEADTTYQFDLKGAWTDDGTLYDPYLRGVHNAGGERIDNTTDNDSGQNLNSRVYFTPDETATYYVAAGADDAWHGAPTRCRSPMSRTTTRPNPTPPRPGRWRSAARSRATSKPLATMTGSRWSWRRARPIRSTCKAAPAGAGRSPIPSCAASTTARDAISRAATTTTSGAAATAG